MTNLAAGHGFCGTTPIDSDTDTETVTATQTPTLTLVKTASPTTYDAVGDTISYSYLLTNTGNVTLSGPFTVTDDKATDEACPATPASLAPGERHLHRQLHDHAGRPGRRLGDQHRRRPRLCGPPRRFGH